MTLVGEKVTKSPKRRRAKHIEKTNEELAKRRREAFYQKKRYLVADLRIRGYSMRTISKAIGMSIGFVCKWCDRLDVQIGKRTYAARHNKKMKYGEGYDIRNAIVSRSRAPKDPHRKITAEHVNAVRKLRTEKYTKKTGAQKIVVRLDMNISHQSVNKILRQEGLTAPRKKRKQRSFIQFRRGYSNELWQMDYKEFGKGIYMLSIKDDYSSKILAADVRSTCTTADVKEIVGKAIEQFGAPRQILSDHGTQWYAAKGGRCEFDEWCKEQKIEHIMGRVRKPTTQGKIERWHGTVLEEAELPPAGSSVEDYGKAVIDFMEFYNNERPHHGIGLQIPTMVYAGGLILPEVFRELGVHEVP